MIAAVHRPDLDGGNQKRIGQPASHVAWDSQSNLEWPHLADAEPSLHEHEGRQTQLPSYIAPLPPDLDPDIIQFLHRKGALSLPTPTMRDELMRVYVCYVHPFLPLLDLGAFIKAVASEDETCKISLILFQAVMFAGASFVDMSCLESEGFQDRKQACRALFRRLRLLYDADVEPDPTTLVKVLLLMTYQCDKPGDTKGRFYYLRIAVSLAADIGLNESLTSGHHSTKQLKMKRRLWWCCLMRENLLAMSERRTAGISTDISTVPIPHLDDLNDTDLSEALCRFYMPNSETDARILSKLCIQKIKLCVLIDRILDTLYELGHHQPLTTTGPAMLLIPKLSDSLTAEGIARDQELRQWYAELCSTEGSMVGQDHRRNGRVVGPHSAILEMLFYTVVGMVHRPLLLHTQSKESAANALQDFSRQTLRLAAQRITDIANPLAEGNLIRFLPSVGVPALLAASMQHVKDALSANHTISAAALMSLEQTMHSMVELRGIHCPVECTMGLFEFVRSRKINSQHTALGQESVPQYPGERPRSFATTSTRDSRTSLGHETLVYNNPDQSASVLLNQKHASTGAALTATVDDDSTRHGRATGIQQEELLNFRLPFANIESLTEAVLSGVCDAADFNAFHS